MRSTRLVLGLAMAAGLAFAPNAGAMPASKPPAGLAPAAQSDVVLAGHHGQVRIGIHWHGKHIYYNGHRGYRHKRHGYRHHHGYWFPRGAFVVVVPRQRYIPARPYHPPKRIKPRIVRLSHSHYRWCDAKYRSYRSSDNTFQPYHGPRKQCVSPYY